MIDVEYMGERPRYIVSQRKDSDRYGLYDRIDRLYKSEGWAQRKAKQLRAQHPQTRGGYVVRRIWVKTD